MPLPGYVCSYRHFTMNSSSRLVAHAVCLPRRLPCPWSGRTTGTFTVGLLAVALSGVAARTARAQTSGDNLQ